MRWTSIIVCGLGAAALAIIAGPIVRSLSSVELAAQPAVQDWGPTELPATRIAAALPAMSPAKVVSQEDADEVPDGAPVVGITLGGHYRAYSLHSFRKKNLEVVNDRLSDIPLAVAYSRHTDEARVFTHPSGSPLHMAGIASNNQIWLHYGGQTYAFSDEVPLVEQQHSRMTWGEWRQLHPDSDLCVGVINEPKPRPTPADQVSALLDSRDSAENM